MRRVEARVVSALLLLVLGIALASVALGPDFDPPGHYDGDGDDVGLIWKTLSQWADIPVIGGQLRFIASVPLDVWRPMTHPDFGQSPGIPSGLAHRLPSGSPRSSEHTRPARPRSGA